MNPFKAFAATLFSKNTSAIDLNMLPSIYDISINNLQGKPIDLKTFKGKHILFVNVASKCGFTPQYKALQELQENYSETLTVIGVPCNQFGSQEPGNADAIEVFCEVNYGVSFLITEKIDVKGKQQHPLYAWLTKASKNGKSSSSVKWNFQKYMVSPDGKLLDYFYSTTTPNSSKIIKYLK